MDFYCAFSAASSASFPKWCCRIGMQAVKSIGLEIRFLLQFFFPFPGICLLMTTELSRQKKRQSFRKKYPISSPVNLKIYEWMQHIYVYRPYAWFLKSFQRTTITENIKKIVEQLLNWLSRTIVNYINYICIISI